jgi:hypothetical protein
LLGFDKEALRYSAILGYNYSSSKWYKRAYALVGKGRVAEGDDKTFVGKVLDTFGLRCRARILSAGRPSVIS